MMSEKGLEAFRAYMGCQCSCFQNAKREGDGIYQPFVTISRQTGAGGITVGEKLVKFLREHDKSASCPWTIFDRNLVKRVIEEHDLPHEVERFMPEHKRSELQNYFEELFNLHPSEWTLLHKTSETILHLAQMGDAVIVGRGANIITRSLPAGFHVKLISSLAKRLKHIQEYYQMKKDKAGEFLTREDQGRKEYIKKHFDRNIDDPLLYDLVINTDRVSYDRAAEMIGREVLCIRDLMREKQAERQVRHGKNDY